jgi:hypothetical protein
VVDVLEELPDGVGLGVLEGVGVLEAAGEPLSLGR